MATNSDLPCDGDGVCMVCKKTPSENETLTCKTCVTPWHVNCLSTPPETLAATVQWECPDCSFVVDPNPVPNPTVEIANGSNSSGDLIAAVRLIENDKSLTDQEKAKRRQELMCGGGKSAVPEVEKKKASGSNDVLNLFDESMNCSFCMQLPERPVTTPCGHNFCLKCFQKWVGQGKRTCANCRSSIPPKMASQPRINSALVVAIRMAKISKCSSMGAPSKVYHFVHNQNRPDKCYTTERAKKTGKANACSGKIFVTVPPDHFGPILAQNDPERNQGVLVGETWEDRMECRQWGAHLPHVAGIAGQSDYGAQSVALSGGYEDDEDHGEWFLYTGSGGRDLSGNKRTNKTQSFDQKFDKSNEALRVSCKMGYPVRVVRSHKEKRSCYAPEAGVRYDGIYRIEKCWRKEGIQGFKVCRYLFVRCDNAPAPWTSDEIGDRPRPLPTIGELKKATDVTERKGTASWDYDEGQGCWAWKKPPPESRKRVADNHLEDGGKITIVRRKKPAMSIRDKLLKEFSCLICQKVMNLPLTTPCAHNFCKPCLEGAFAGKAFVKERTCEGRRTLRAQKNVFKCPSCENDITDFLQNPQVNRELMGVIESLQQQNQEVEEDEPSEENDVSDEIKTDVNIPPDSEEGKDGSPISPSKIEEPEQTDDDLEKPKAGNQVLLENPLADVPDSPVKDEVKETAVDNNNKGKPRGRKPRAKEGAKVSPSEVQEKTEATDDVLQEKPPAIVETSPVKSEMTSEEEPEETAVDDEKAKRTPKRKQVDNVVVVDSPGKTRGQKARIQEGSALSPSKEVAKEAAADKKVMRTPKRKQAENVAVAEGMGRTTRGQKAKRMI